MARYGRPRIAPIVVVVIIAVIAIVAIITVARSLMSGNSSKTTTKQVDTSQEALLSTTADRKVRMTVRGPIVADESFRSYQVEITPSSRTLTTFNGYLDSQVDQKQLDNNVSAYDQFVHALNKANLVKGQQLTADKDDTRGVCATGVVYEFSIMQGDTTIKHLWTSTCKGSAGSLDASLAQVRALFLAQIPDHTALLSKIGFGEQSSQQLSL